MYKIENCIFFLFILLSITITNAQTSQVDLILNPTTSLYEYSEIQSTDFSTTDFKTHFEKKLALLNFKDIVSSDNTVKGESFISFLIMGTTIQVHYQIFIEYRDGKYKLLINRFVLDDKRWSPIPLEDMKSHTKKWIKEISKKLPPIISALKSPPEEW